MSPFRRRPLRAHIHLSILRKSQGQSQGATKMSAITPGRPPCLLGSTVNIKPQASSSLKIGWTVIQHSHHSGSSTLPVGPPANIKPRASSSSLKIGWTAIQHLLNPDSEKGHSQGTNSSHHSGSARFNRRVARAARRTGFLAGVVFGHHCFARVERTT